MRPVLQYHRELTDPALAPFLGQYFQQLRHLYNAGTRWYTGVRVTDKYTALLQLDGIHMHVKLVGVESKYFEFATTGYPIERVTTSQSGGSFEGYRGCIVGVDVVVRGDRLDLVPYIRGGKRTNNGADVSRIGRPYQAQLVNEPVTYPNGGTFRGIDTHFTALYESWAPGNSHTGIGLRGTENLAGLDNWLFAGPMTQHIERDVLFDVPFRKGEKLAKVRSAYLQGAADWPRACGLQTVEHPKYGTRQFAIYVDAFNQFFAFPTEKIEEANGVAQNVDSFYVKRAAPSFPDWCYLPATKFRDYYAGDDNPNHSLIDQPELDWKFRHDGKRAATIVYERSPFEFDSAYWAIDASATPFTQAYFDQIVAAMGVQGRNDQFSYAQDHNPEHFYTAPGIVEATVDIALTGVRADQYSFDVSIAEVRRPATATYCPLVVGYVWYDIPVEPATDPITYLARRGDFISIDVEKWAIKTGTPADQIAAGRQYTEVLSFRNLDTDEEILCRVARALLAVDMTTLSYVTEAYPLGSGTDPNYLCAAVNVKGYLREILTPQTPCSEEETASMHEWATKDGRQFVNDLVDGDARWQYIPLNPAAGDGWDNPQMSAFRINFGITAKFYRFTIFGAQSVFNGPPPYDNYKTGLPINTADANSGEEDAYYRWDQYPHGGVGVVPSMFATNPRWGWNTYHSIVNSRMYLCPDTTFYTHPNGTWVYWHNTNVFVPFGIIEQPDRLAGFDVEQVEHVVLDHVHIVLDTPKATYTVDTSMYSLYNRAVAAGLAADSLDDGIEQMTPTVLRAEFFKSTIFAPPSTTYLDLGASWDGQLWYRPDAFVFSGGVPSDSLRTGAVIRGLNFNQFWYNGPYYAGFTYSASLPAQIKPHVRFANPILVGV